MSKSKVSLVYLNNTGYVFNDKEYMTLRKEFRIIGKFVGTPENSRPSIPSIPVKLSQFETQLLIEKDIANLFTKSSLLINPCEDDAKETADSYANRILEQRDLFIKDKIKKSKFSITKLRRKRKSSTDEPLAKDVEPTEDKILPESRDQVMFKTENVLLEIPCQHIYRHNANLLSEFPTKIDLFKYKIFRTIWEKGFYITPGETFGADFIIYTGDPLLYHGSYIIVAKDDNRINLYEVITKCRLSVNVNKTIIYVYQNKSGNLSYQIINWEGSTV